MSTLQHLSHGRREIVGRGLDSIAAAARCAGDVPELRKLATVVVAAADVCRQELDRDPLTGPFPQSEAALGQALAALGPLGSAPCRKCIEFEEWLRSLAAAYGTLVYDIAATRYRPSRRRGAVLGAAHKVEVASGPIREVLRALEQLDKAGWALDKYRLTLDGISAHAGLGRTVVAGGHNERGPR